MEFSAKEILSLIERASVIPDILRQKEEIEDLLVKFEDLEEYLKRFHSLDELLSHMRDLEDKDWFTRNVSLVVDMRSSREIVESPDPQIPGVDYLHLPIFEMLARDGNVDEHVMFNTYNMGIGMVLSVASEDVDATLAAIEAAGEKPYVIGHVEAGDKGVELV